MVETAEAWQRSQTRIADWLWLDRTSTRRVFAQRIMDAVFVVIADVLADDAAEVIFIHRDDMVENLAAAASDPSSAVPFCHDARMLVRLRSGPSLPATQ